MPRIAYVTDLHITPASRGRVNSLIGKMACARNRVNAYFIGGDTFTLFGSEHWDALIKRPANVREVSQMTRHSAEITREFLPRIIQAADGLPIHMLQGNADALSLLHIVSNPNDFSGVHPINKEAVNKLEGFRIVGLGGIEATDAGAFDILKYNPWYQGVYSPQDFYGRLGLISDVTRLWNGEGWKKTILLTHQPAMGWVDLFSRNHEGSKLIRDFIYFKHPLIHLAGHVHDAPTAMNEATKVKEYRFSMARDVIYGKTLTVNPGGDRNHDPDVRVVIIDLDILARDPENRGDAVSLV